MCALENGGQHRFFFLLVRVLVDGDYYYYFFIAVGRALHTAISKGVPPVFFGAVKISNLHYSLVLRKHTHKYISAVRPKFSLETHVCNYHTGDTSIAGATGFIWRH